MTHLSDNEQSSRKFVQLTAHLIDGQFPIAHILRNSPLARILLGVPGPPNLPSRVAMSSSPFHLGWFMNFTAGDWDSDFAVGGAPWDGKFYIDMAQALERACFDYIMLEDTVMVSESYGGSTEAALRHALMVPKHDPAPLAALLGGATKHLGVAATMSTLGYPPFMLARLCSTLDHLTGGRFGWNIVTSGEMRRRRISVSRNCHQGKSVMTSRTNMSTSSAGCSIAGIPTPSSWIAPAAFTPTTPRSGQFISRANISNAAVR
jgi:hypothetical protein